MKAIGFFLLVFATMIAIDTKTTTDTNNTKPQVTWSVEDSKAYGYDSLNKWRDKQWVCLNRLWSKESAWKSTAYNKIKVMGKNAGGIPQLLGLDPKTPAPRQIDRGLEYIYYRYTTPCNAWAHFRKYGWH